MNALEAIKKVKNGGRIERKLSNGKTEVKNFYMNGQIREHYFKDENGILNGEYKWWWNNGTIGGQKNFKNGNLHGEYKWWREDGTLDEHKLYEDGKFIKKLLDK